MNPPTIETALTVDSYSSDFHDGGEPLAPAPSEKEHAGDDHCDHHRANGYCQLLGVRDLVINLSADLAQLGFDVSSSDRLVRRAHAGPFFVRVPILNTSAAATRSATITTKYGMIDQLP